MLLCVAAGSAIGASYTCSLTPISPGQSTKFFLSDLAVVRPEIRQAESGRKGKQRIFKLCLSWLLRVTAYGSISMQIKLARFKPPMASAILLALAVIIPEFEPSCDAQFVSDFV